MSEGGMQRGRNVWLIGSLCLNVLLIAMIVVGLMRAWHLKQEAALGRAFSAQSIAAHLPADRAAKVRAIIAAHAPRMKALNAAADEARRRARGFFVATQFDPDGYTKAQQTLRAANDALEAERLDQVGDIAAILSADERREIVERARVQDKTMPRTK